MDVRVYGCTGVWMGVWMYGCMDVRVYGWVYGCMGAWMYGCMDVRVYGCTVVYGICIEWKRGPVATNEWVGAYVMLSHVTEQLTGCMLIIHPVLSAASL